jgi:TPR repeat protein
MRLRAVAIVLVGMFAACMSDAIAKQVAIVVGNNTYQEITPLTAGVNDARAMAGGLQRVGFKVELVENGTKREISRALSRVEGQIEPGDTVVFHFSGHGFEIDGQNWLLPVDVPAARVGEAGLVKDGSFNAADVVDRFRARGAGTVVAILDACRNNPFAQGGTRALSGSRGLASMDASGGVFIMFSAGQKQEALDRLSANDPAETSVFVRSFLPLLGRPDLSLIDIAKETQHKVRELARSVGHEQVPAYYDGIVGRVTLTGAPVAAPAPQQVAAAAPVQNLAAEQTFWRSIEDSNQPAMFEAYLAQVEKKVFAGTYTRSAEEKLTALRSRAPSSVPATPTPATPPPNQQASIATTLPKAPAVDAASSPDVAACDSEAADPMDPEKPANTRGVEMGVRSAVVAVSACGKAAATANAPRRVFYQLSRAYEATGSQLNALESLRKAADLGHPMALFTMADRHLAGRGVPRDPAKAMSMFYRAGDAGVKAAIVKVGGMYASGNGAERDYVKAVAIFNMALKHREPSVYPDLGLLYLHGRGVTRDKRKACDLFEQGAALGNRTAAQHVTSFCKS